MQKHPEFTQSRKSLLGWPCVCIRWKVSTRFLIIRYGHTFLKISYSSTLCPRVHLHLSGETLLTLLRIHNLLFKRGGLTQNRAPSRIRHVLLLLDKHVHNYTRRWMPPSFLPSFLHSCDLTEWYLSPGEVFRQSEDSHGPETRLSVWPWLCTFFGLPRCDKYPL